MVINFINVTIMVGNCQETEELIMCFNRKGYKNRTYLFLKIASGSSSLETISVTEARRIVKRLMIRNKY